MMERMIRKTAAFVMLLAVVAALAGPASAASGDELVLSASSNKLEASADADGYTRFTARTVNGRKIEFIGYRISRADGAFLRMESDGWLLQLDATHGMFGIEIDAEGGRGNEPVIMHVGGIYDAGGTGRLEETYSGEEQTVIGLFQSDGGGYRYDDEVGASFIRIRNDTAEYGEVPSVVKSIKFSCTGERVSVKELLLLDDWNKNRLILDGEYYDEQRMAYFTRDQRPFKGVRVTAKLSNGHTIWQFDGYSVGELFDPGGKAADKEETRLHRGYELEIRAGSAVCYVPFDCVTESDRRPADYHEQSGGKFPEAEGEFIILFIPVCFTDDTEEVKNGEFLDMIREAAGVVTDGKGNEDTWSSRLDTFMSLNEYFTNASLGKLQVKGYLADWYDAGMTAEEAYSTFVDQDFVDGAVNRARADHPELDWSRFDSDGDGRIDAVCLINTINYRDHGSYSIYGFSGAYGFIPESGAEPSAAGVGNYVTLNRGFFIKDVQGRQISSNNTLIHEVSHMMGIPDYYDYSYSGFLSLGGYDMQDQDAGDWNCFSKFAVGWNEPTVVTEETVEKNKGMFTIYSSAVSGSCLAIPARGKDLESPFSEYIMVDLCTDEGNNAMNAREYGLTGARGVRIYHVDARVYDDAWEDESGRTQTGLETFYGNEYNDNGMYMIELCPRNMIGSRDYVAMPDLENRMGYVNALYRVNDRFGRDAQDTFLYGGLLDSGEEFGWCITVAETGVDRKGRSYAKICVTPIEDAEPQFSGKNMDDILVIAASAAGALLAAAAVALAVHNKKKKRESA